MSSMKQTQISLCYKVLLLIAHCLISLYALPRASFSISNHLIELVSTIKQCTRSLKLKSAFVT